MPHTSKQPHKYTNEFCSSSSSFCQAPWKQIWGILPDKKKIPHGWPACLRRQPPRVAFKNKDIYAVDNEESSNYEEPRERHPKVQYKLRVCENPTAKNMPHEEEYDDNNYESIDETTV